MSPLLQSFSKPDVISFWRKMVMNFVQFLKCLFRLEVPGPTLEASLKKKYIYISVYFIWASAQRRSWIVCVASMFARLSWSCFFLMSRLLEGPHGSVTRWLPLPGNHPGLSASWSRMCHEPRRASFPCVLRGAKKDDKVCEANESYISRHSGCKPGYTQGRNTLLKWQIGANGWEALWMGGGGGVNGTYGQFSRWCRWLIYIDSLSPMI